MRNFILFLLAFFLLNPVLSAQKLPATDVLLFDFNQKTDSLFQFSNPKLLTGFNPEGYNNQPFFVNDHELYLSVQFPEDTAQTDIYSLNLKSLVLTRVTETVESEYSPMLVPGREGIDESPSFSCIREENGEGVSQRLWKFPIDRSNDGQVVFPSISDIGYHHWLSYREVLLFLVGNPHSLVVANLRDQSTRYVISNIGRCFQEMPNGDIAFVHKLDATTWLIKRLHSRTFSTHLITAALPGSEDFAVLGDGTIIMAKGAKVFKFNKTLDTAWLEIGDFSYYGVRQISRIAVNKAGKKIALVVE